ncbi:hypothetical protein B9Z55_022638 [Caenorhabditis nigoni]|uniref:Uncharacterized protein n=1 Tax=Caenorhabditis nigoni TaxID=1611254 RepID=A0A2G5SL65_9PELO|nr:hypothetical protein B9Z55_022638 [Caenorhabditis nigoni]
MCQLVLLNDNAAIECRSAGDDVFCKGPDQAIKKVIVSDNYAEKKQSVDIRSLGVQAHLCKEDKSLNKLPKLRCD